MLFFHLFPTGASHVFRSVEPRVRAQAGEKFLRGLEPDTQREPGGRLEIRIAGTNAVKNE